MKFGPVAAPCTEWCEGMGKEHGPVCHAFVKSLAITKARRTHRRSPQRLTLDQLHCALCMLRHQSLCPVECALCSPSPKENGEIQLLSQACAGSLRAL